MCSRICSQIAAAVSHDNETNLVTGWFFMQSDMEFCMPNS